MITPRQRAARQVTARIANAAGAVLAAAKRDAYAAAPRLCSRCRKPLSWKQRHNVFCGSSCSAATTNKSRVHSQESRLRVSETIKAWHDSRGRNPDSEPETRRCLICDGEFVVRKKSLIKRFCSQACRNKAPWRRNAGGGAQPGGGFGICGWYSGIYCGSTWELAFVVYCLDHGVNIARCAEAFWYDAPDRRKRKYLPDFVVNGTLTEIKGFIVDRAIFDAKIASVVSAGRRIDVLFKADMEPILAYAKARFGEQIEVAYEKRAERGAVV